MSTYWICDRTDERFDDYEAAWDHYHEHLYLDNFADHFHEYVPYESLLNWAMKQDAFWHDVKMQDYYDRADSDCFESQYFEHEEDDELE